MLPPHAHHHTQPTNTTAQPPTQATWLLTAAGREGNKPPRINAADPQAAADALVAEAKQLGLYTGSLERLRDHLVQGYGNGATALLNTLCDMALERQGFAWQVPQRIAAADRYGRCTCRIAANPHSYTCHFRHHTSMISASYL